MSGDVDDDDGDDADWLAPGEEDDRCWWGCGFEDASGPGWLPCRTRARVTAEAEYDVGRGAAYAVLWW